MEKRNRACSDAPPDGSSGASLNRIRFFPDCVLACHAGYLRQDSMSNHILGCYVINKGAF